MKATTPMRPSASRRLVARERRESGPPQRHPLLLGGLLGGAGGGILGGPVGRKFTPAIGNATRINIKQDLAA